MAISRPYRQPRAQRATPDRWMTGSAPGSDLHTASEDACDVGRLGRAIIVGSLLGGAVWIGLIVTILRVVRALT